MAANTKVNFPAIVLPAKIQRIATNLFIVDVDKFVNKGLELATPNMEAVRHNFTNYDKIRKAEFVELKPLYAELSETQRKLYATFCKDLAYSEILYAYEGHYSEISYGLKQKVNSLELNLAQTKTEADRDRNDLRGQIRDLSHKADKAERERDALREELDVVQEILQDYEGTRIRVSEIDELIAEHDARLAEKDSIIADLQAEIANLQEEVRFLRSELSITKQVVKDLTYKVETYSESLKEYKSLARQNKYEILALKKENAEQGQLIAEQGQLIAEQGQLIVELRQQLADLSERFNAFMSQFSFEPGKLAQDIDTKDKAVEAHSHSRSLMASCFNFFINNSDELHPSDLDFITQNLAKIRILLNFLWKQYRLRTKDDLNTCRGIEGMMRCIEAS